VFNPNTTGKKKRRRKEETADLELWVGFWEEPGARIL
jgi:hypothetical protein